MKERERLAEVQLGVVALIVDEQCRVLFLRRPYPPYFWCPPSGHVREGELLLDALHREVKEETALTVRVLSLASVWQGTPKGRPILSVTYVCEAITNKVAISAEHTSFQWFSLENLPEVHTDFEIEQWPLYLENAYKIQPSNFHVSRQSFTG